jgi:N-acetylglucosamine malate deacetylase 1
MLAGVVLQVGINLMTNNILIVAAHTDDEALGCGGTIAHHIAQGDAVHAVFLADGITSRSNANREMHTKRISSAEKAHKILGLKSVEYLNYLDNQLDSLPLLEIVKQLEKVVEKISPNIVYTHHRGDLNIDHQVCYQAVITACRPLPDSTIKEIYTFEVMSSTDWNQSDVAAFIPQMYIDISKFLDTKIRALAAYEDEMHDAPHSRSIDHIKSLATYRGNTVGLHAAEAFMIIRLIK